VLLGGRLLGMNTAGLYSVPRQLILSVQGLVNPIVTRVGFPLIARSQHDGEQTSIVYRRMVNAIALTNAPIYSAIAVLHIDICALLLGPGWADSAGLLIPLSVWGYLRSLQNPVGALLLGLGRAKRALAWNCALLVFYPVAIVIGSKFGVIGLASSLLVTALILLVPGWRWLVQPFTGWELRGYLATTILPLLIAIGCCLAAKILTQQMANVPLRIGMTLLVAGMGYLLAVPFISPVAGQLARSCIHFRR
jgi:O-antigen/teichoic acid export membrane protein